MEKWDLLYTISANVNQCKHYGKWYEDFSKTKKINYNITQQFHSLLYSWIKTKTLFQEDICTQIFIAALYTIAKI